MPTLSAKYQRWSGTIALILLAVASSWGLHLVNREGEQRSAVDRARTAQVDWDAQLARHRSCQARAQSQVASRDAWRKAVRLLSTPRPGESPQRRAETVETVAELNAKLDMALKPQDCSRVSPAPKGPRPRIP